MSAIGAAPSSDQKPAGNPARINACTILTPDMAAKFAAATKIKVTSPPTEGPIGVNVSQCDYGGLGLHIDPFSAEGADRMRKSPRSNWVPVTGVGDTAYFHNVQTALAEMIVWSGCRQFGILMDVPGRQYV